MAGKPLYLDASALVKLVVAEPETPALRRLLGDWPVRVTSEVAAVEVMRATRRTTREAMVWLRAEQVLAGVHLLRFDAETLDQAARLDPPNLRTLDALHLAAALSLEEELGAMVVYDARLAAAAHESGIPVLAPR